VSLSPTLNRNEKVEEHIRKKTHKLNTLRFWVVGGVIPSCGFDSVLILMRSPHFASLDYRTLSNPFVGCLKCFFVVDYDNLFKNLQNHGLREIVQIL